MVAFVVSAQNVVGAALGQVVAIGIVGEPTPTNELCWGAVREAAMDEARQARAPGIDAAPGSYPDEARWGVTRRGGLLR